jgi:predicted nuclease with RNAse H fold
VIAASSRHGAADAAWSTPDEETFALGIDLGAQALHVVGVTAQGFISVCGVIELTELRDSLATVPAGCVVAIDAPATPSRGFHKSDVGLKPKFRTARCAEIALGVGRGYWVPWATPLIGGDFPAWMVVGFSVYDAVREAGFRAIEVYPHSIFREFAGGLMPPPKQTAAGSTRREQLLRSHGINAEWLRMWSHDAMDAAAAALVASAARVGVAQEVTCGHDGSAIWLPPRP